MDNKIPQVDHLILLVGSNPLPNLVVADVLVKEGGSVYLLCTDETREIAEKLKALISTRKKHLIEIKIKRIENESSSPMTPQSITKIIKDIAKDINFKIIGLNYTGGTKLMGVHAYLALEQEAQESAKLQFSYLDAKNMCLIIEEGDKNKIIPLRNHVKIKLEQLIDLHGWTFQSKNKDVTREPENIELARDILDVMRRSKGTNEDVVDHKSDWETWRKWLKIIKDEKTIKKNNKENKDHLTISINEKDNETAKTLLSKVKDDQITKETKDNVLSLFFNNQKLMTKFIIWLEGNWLEDLVLDIIKNIKIQNNSEKYSFDDWGMGIHFKMTHDSFEIDVFGIIDFQFFLFSVTTDSSKKLCKCKLMEAYIRAKQLGGDEACAALISFAGTADVEALQHELASLFIGTQAKIRVFGMDDWQMQNENEALIVSKIRNWVSTNINK